MLLLVLSVGWLTAAPQVPNLSLVPSNTGGGRPGETVIYVHTLTNLGDGPDTVTLSVDSSRNWAVTVSPIEVTLDQQEDVLVLVTLVVPNSAQFGQVDVTTVTATSGLDPGVTASTTDTTLVPSPVLLPIAYGVGGVPPPECQLIPPPVANPPGVDLIVTGITIIPASPPAGQAATVAVTIKNQGQSGIAVGNNFYLDFYDDPDPEPPGPLQPGILNWGVQGANFQAGVSRTYSAPYIFGPGLHHLYAQVDTDNTVSEDNENNNVYGCASLFIGGRSQTDSPETTFSQPVESIRPTPTPPAPAVDERQ